jgi:hypothetical protein
MRSKPRRKPIRWCLPAKALLDQFEEGTWANIIAERLGTSRANIQRWREGTTNFDPYTADKYAIRLGKHPCQIWPEWFDLPQTETTDTKEKRNVRK